MIGRVANYHPQIGHDYIVKCMFCDFQGSGTIGHKGNKAFRCGRCFKPQYICEGEAEYESWMKIESERQREAEKAAKVVVYEGDFPPGTHFGPGFHVISGDRPLSEMSPK